jgi:hypothetical protein
MAKFTPSATMISAAEMVFAAMAMLQTIGPVVLAYKTNILKEGQWHIKPEFSERCGDEVILDPKRAYMLSDADFSVYDTKCKQARDLAGLSVDHPEQCPLLVAEHLEIQANHALVLSMEGITKITLDKLLSSGMDRYKEYIDLTLRLLAPYVKNPLADRG